MHEVPVIDEHDRRIYDAEDDVVDQLSNELFDGWPSDIGDMFHHIVDHPDFIDKYGHYYDWRVRVRDDPWFDDIEDKEAFIKGWRANCVTALLMHEFHSIWLIKDFRLKDKKHLGMLMIHEIAHILDFWHLGDIFYSKTPHQYRWCMQYLSIVDTLLGIDAAFKLALGFHEAHTHWTWDKVISYLQNKQHGLTKPRLRQILDRYDAKIVKRSKLEAEDMIIYQPNHWRSEIMTREQRQSPVYEKTHGKTNKPLH